MEIFHSAFIVPLGAFAVAIVAIVSGIAGDVAKSRAKAEQRMAMLARGMPIADIERLLGVPGTPEISSPKDPMSSLGNARRTAIVLTSIGIGVIFLGIALTVIIGVREILSCSAAGLIPLAVGIGFFVDYNLQKRELARFGLEIGPDRR
jgi:hypothetical protein